MTTQAEGAALILKGLADVEANDKQLEELRLRQWTQSEIDKLVAYYQDSPTLGPAMLDTLMDHVAQAQAEGRVTDDVTPNVANLQAKHGGPRSWVFNVADSVFLESYGRDLLHNPRPGTAWELHQPNVGLLQTQLDWVSPAEGAQRAVQAMVAQERRADGEDIGLTLGDAMPKWAEFFTGDPHVPAAGSYPLAMNRPADPEVADLVQAMSERMTTLEAVYSYIIEVYRTTPVGELTLPMDEVLDLPMSPGMRWRSYPSIEAFRAELAVYRRETNAAWGTISPALTAINRQHRYSASQAIIRASVPTMT